jgi:PAS domain S-box-containing protein
MSDAPMVLIVDDDPGMCETVGDVLELRGFRVDVAHSGRAALQRLATRAAEAALVDISLPDLSGLELLAEIKRSAPTTEVICITGHASLPTAIEALNASAFAYIVKPFDMDELVATLGKAVEKQRLAEALRRSEERYRFVSENISDAVFLVDLDGRPVFSNAQVSAITGYRPEELRTMNLLALLAPGGDKMDRGRTGGGPEHPATFFEAAVVRKDGRQAWVEASVTDVVQDGRVVGHLGVARDITERRHGEAALRETNQMLQALIEASPLAIFAMDTAGAITMWNPAAERMFGWRADEVLGGPLPFGLEGGDIPSVAPGASPPVRSDGAEMRCQRKDGSFVDGSLSFASLCDAAGAVIGVVTIAADITQRKHLQEQLRQAQKLEAIGRLAGGIAHDFNNLLTVIGGRSHIMGWRVAEDDPMRRDLEIIEQAADRAAGLTRQLLAFSRKQVQELRVVELKEVVGGLERMLQRLIGEDVELVTRADDEPGRVRVDPTQIEQVILNLVVNARDAMPNGGQLIIETASVDVDEEAARAHVGLEPGPYVRLQVTDTGHGMDQATRDQMFVPFFTTKAPGKGTGLGLATVYGIVKQTGGHIWVESEVGRGATFRIYLPRVEAAVDVVVGGAAATAPARGSETVLLAEDDADVRALARETLEASGYTVLEAPRPEEALRIAREGRRRIDVLVADVVMPEMSGRALADELRARQPDLKVLFMSGYASDAIVHHGVLDTGTALLSKPFTPGALVRRIREVLDERR